MIKFSLLAYKNQSHAQAYLQLLITLKVLGIYIGIKHLKYNKIKYIFKE